MKRIFVLFLFSVFGMTALISCSSRQNSTTTGGSILGNVASSLLSILAGLLQGTGNGTAAANLDLGTKLNSVVKGTEMVASFKNLLASTYKIPMEAVNKAYAGFTNLTSVATFIMQNANPQVLSTVK